MRRAALPVLALPLLLTYCGAKQDLIIGEVALITEAGTGATGATGATSGAGLGPATGGSTAGISSSGGSETAGSSEGGAPSSAGGAAGEAPVDCLAGEAPPDGSLIHRYSFDGTGTTVSDTIGGADGKILGGPMLDGTGAITFEGNDGDYVDLPNGLISSLTDVTFVTWVTWTGGGAYQRILDFGISDAGEVIGGSGRSYIAILPFTGFVDNTVTGLGVEIKRPNTPTLQIASNEKMRDRAGQVGLVFQSGLRAALYLDGNLLGETPTTISLSDIDDRNNWLGQSQWMKDPAFEGMFEELRIYDVALNACQLHSLLVRGPSTP
jgi:hypothetical protein